MNSFEDLSIEEAEQARVDLPDDELESKLTDLTDQTEIAIQTSVEISIENDEFLQAIFGEISPDSDLRPLVCSKAGDPQQDNGWNPQAWPCDTGAPDLNWYACSALFEPNSKGKYRAQKTLVHSVFCVMLDDIGTKVPMEKINQCPPSWLLETSPQNYQAGYIFSEPVTSAEAEKLKHLLIQADLCDRGSTGAGARWMRLPKAINGKPAYGNPSPKCRLAIWSPERTFTVDDLTEKFELTKIAEKNSKSSKQRKKFDMSAIDDGIYCPKPIENAVLVALKAKELYKKPLGDGKHDITCPWVSEHTDQVDHGSCYFEPSDKFRFGGYKCQHSHGESYRIRELINFLEINEESAKHKPIIRIVKGEFHRIVDAAEEVLALTGKFFQRGGLVVSVVFEGHSKQAAVKLISPAALTRILSSESVWLQYDLRSRDYLVCDPPARHISSLFDSERYNHLAPLLGLARQPHLRNDGSLVRRSGYDKATGYFGIFDPNQYGVTDSPTREEAEQALKELQDLLSEFAFASPQDEAAAISAMLTAAIRPSLAQAPMFHIKAPQIASGKSYLTSIIAKLASPAAISAVAFPKNEEECQKLLLATLLEAPAAVIFDNLTSDLIPHKSLCSALTEESLTGRILGVSKTASVGTRVLFLSSGNNVDPIRDMSRRTITILLDPKVETPATREFKKDPLREINLRREHFVTQALIIVKAFISSGAPILNAKPFASYGQWSDWVRQPLLWLGLPDPAGAVFEQLARDPDHEHLGRLLDTWYKIFGSTPTMIREAVAKVSSAPEFETTGLVDELREAMLAVSDEKGVINRRILGKWISRHQDRIVNGLRFERSRGSTNAERWFVKSVSSVTSVSSGADSKLSQEENYDFLQ
jgi:hypothetical protein